MRIFNTCLPKITHNHSHKNTNPTPSNNHFDEKTGHFQSFIKEVRRVSCCCTSQVENIAPKAKNLQQHQRDNSILLDARRCSHTSLQYTPHQEPTLTSVHSSTSDTQSLIATLSQENIPHTNSQPCEAILNTPHNKTNAIPKDSISSHLTPTNNTNTTSGTPPTTSNQTPIIFKANSENDINELGEFDRSGRSEASVIPVFETHPRALDEIDDLSLTDNSSFVDEIEDANDHDSMDFSEYRAFYNRYSTILRRFTAARERNLPFIQNDFRHITSHDSGYFSDSNSDEEEYHDNRNNRTMNTESIESLFRDNGRSDESDLDITDDNISIIGRYRTTDDMRIDFEDTDSLDTNDILFTTPGNQVSPIATEIANFSYIDEDIVDLNTF